MHYRNSWWYNNQILTNTTVMNSTSSQWLVPWALLYNVTNSITFVLTTQVHPLSQSCRSLNVLTGSRSAFPKRLELSTYHLEASSYHKTQQEQEWRTWPISSRMIQNESTKKSSDSGFLEKASSQWHGPLLLRFYVTLDCLLLLRILVLSNVKLLNSNWKLLLCGLTVEYVPTF